MITLVCRSVKQENSGLIFGTFQMCGTFGTLLITKLGGYLYSHSSQYWPFIMTLGSFGILIIATVILIAIDKNVRAGR